MNVKEKKFTKSYYAYLYNNNNKLHFGQFSLGNGSIAFALSSMLLCLNAIIDSDIIILLSSIVVGLIAIVLAVTPKKQSVVLTLIMIIAIIYQTLYAYSIGYQFGSFCPKSLCLEITIFDKLRLI